MSPSPGNELRRRPPSAGVGDTCPQSIPGGGQECLRGEPQPEAGTGRGRLPGSGTACLRLCSSRGDTPAGDRSGQGQVAKQAQGSPSGAQRSGLGAPSTVRACPLEDGTLRPLAVGDRVGLATAVSGVRFPGSPGARRHLQRDLSGGGHPPLRVGSPPRGSRTVPPPTPPGHLPQPARVLLACWAHSPPPPGRTPAGAGLFDHGLQSARGPGDPGAPAGGAPGCPDHGGPAPGPEGADTSSERPGRGRSLPERPLAVLRPVGLSWANCARAALRTCPATSGPARPP